MSLFSEQPETAESASSSIPMAVAMSEFGLFLQTDLGQSILAAEQAILDHQLPRLSACKLLQLSVQKANPLVADTLVGQNVTMGYAPALGDVSDSCWADYQAFPIASDCIDIVLLHHVLEFSSEPQQLLREADRTLTDSGHLLIMGFNPLSSWSLYRYYCQLQQGKSMTRQTLRLGRLCDWMSVLNYDVLHAQHHYCRPAINHAAAINLFAKVDSLAQKFPLSHGLFYFILARKRTVPVNPVGPIWRASGGTPIPAHSLSPASSVTTIAERSVVQSVAKPVAKPVLKPSVKLCTEQ